MAKKKKSNSLFFCNVRIAEKKERRVRLTSKKGYKRANPDHANLSKDPYTRADRKANKILVVED